MKLQNKVAVITGSSSGIGRAIALLFAQNGANVVLCSNASYIQGEKVLSEIKQNGGNGKYYSSDLRNEDEVRQLFYQVEKDFGIIDILVNNAGRTFNVPFDQIGEESFLNDIETNLLSAVLCSKYAVPLMRHENGWIINTSSIRGFEHTGRPGIIGYSAAKAGVNSFTRNLAYHLAPHIFVNAVAPGFVHTNYIDEMDKQTVDEWINNIPIGRLINPNEIAQVYLLLATSKIFSGSIIIADGGYGILGK